MTFKIEIAKDGETVTLRLIGRIDSEVLEKMHAQLWMLRSPRSPLNVDLDEATILDAGVVRFLIDCETAGIGLLHCPPYLREWMDTLRA